MSICLETSIQRWNGYSSDEKPSTSVSEGSQFHAVDTGEEFIYHNGMWVQDLRRINAIKFAAI